MPGAFELLECFAKRAHQRFVCSLAGSYETDRRQTFPTVHHLRVPASANLLKDFRGCTAAAQVLEFYTLSDGGLLFCDPETERVGIELLKSSSWPLLGAAIRESFADCEAEERPEWLDHFLAFGEVLHSGNFFVLPIAGPDAGKVLYCDHEGPTATVWASNFEDFIAQIIEDPADQLDRMGCFLRFAEKWRTVGPRTLFFWRRDCVVT